MTKRLEALIKEIMQSGFDVAMGGDLFLSEEQNKKNQEVAYHKAIEEHKNKLLSILTEEVEKLRGRENVSNRCNEYSEDLDEAICYDDGYCEALSDVLALIRQTKVK